MTYSTTIQVGFEPCQLSELKTFEVHHMTKDENIGNHGYIGTSILRIYRRILEKNIGRLKIIKNS